MSRPIDLRPQDQAIVEQILRKVLPSSAKVWAFGSRARWTARDGSDLDLAIDAGRPLHSEESAKLRDAFEDSSLPFTVDVVDWMTISEEFRCVIEGDKVRLNLLQIRLLGDLMTSFDRLRKPVKESERRQGPFPYYGASGIVDSVDQYLFDGEYLLVAEDGENLRTRQTPIAFMATGKFWANNHAHVIQGNTEADTRYLMYALQISDVSAYLTGSTMPKLTAANLARIPIHSRSLDEQRAIVKILQTLDDKIDLNRRMNETLEAMAQALFKSWFVDFDPIYAKAEGRDLGLTPEIAALFPDAFEDFEYGKIPKGWRHSTIGSECSRCGGTVQTGPFGSQLHAADYLDKGVPVVMPQNIEHRRVSIKRISRVGNFDTERLSRHRLRPGDIVYSRRGDVEKHALISERESGWICGTGSLLVRFGTLWPSPLFASIHLDMPDTRAWISRHMPNINTSILSETPILMPPDPLIQAFARSVNALNERSILSYEESENLVILRDALLPKLISGELRLRDAERILEKSA